ncbi:ABC transporter permease [Streptomyces sp. NPDC005438]|uniref:ABC transporter permease n=1 Tax=Streptomyces sp. NPDC005438 TaxID=3156880 RepID=UPI0033AE275A
MPATQAPGKAPGAPSTPPPEGALFHPTVARLTLRALLGRRRALILFALPALLLLLSVVVRLMVDADDDVAVYVLGGFGMATMVPLVGVIAGTGAIGPEIDDGSVVYLLSKPLRRSSIITTKLVVAVGVAICFSALPMLLSGFLLNGNGQSIAVAYAVGSAVAALAYGALFLMIGTISRHAVVFSLVYALLWEALVGNLVPGARTLSVQQWATALAEKVAAPGAGVNSDVSYGTSMVLLVVVTVGATWFAGRRLRSMTVSGDE